MEEQNKKKQSSVISTGVVSLITVFAVLLLASFSLLILSNSRTDSRLSTQTSQAVTNYYIADATAEETIAHLDTLRQSSSDDFEQLGNTLEQNGYTLVTTDGYSSYNGIVVTFAITIDEHKTLNVDVGLPQDKGKSIERLRWQTIALS